MTKSIIKFDRFENVPAGEIAEQTVRKDGRAVGLITKNIQRHARTFRYEVVCYSVEIDAGETSQIRAFDVSDFGTARKAHNAAKAWARAVA